MSPPALKFAFPSSQFTFSLPAQKTSFSGAPSCTVSLKQPYIGWFYLLLQWVSPSAPISASPPSQLAFSPLRRNPRFPTHPYAQFLYNGSILAGTIRSCKIQAPLRRYSLFRPRCSLSCFPHEAPCFLALSHALFIRDGQTSVWVTYCSNM